MKRLTARELAQLVGGHLVGCSEAVVEGISSLEEAGAEHASFLGNHRYRPRVVPSKAAVVLVPRDFDEEPPSGRAWVVCDHVSSAFSKLVEFFAPPPVEYPPGPHPSAVVHETAKIADSAHIGPLAVVGAYAVIGPESAICAGVFIGQEARVGTGCLIYPNVTVRERCLLGDRVIIHSGTAIGSDGFGFVPGRESHTKIPQYGIVQIDDDVEIGAQVAVDRARFGRTWIKRGAKIDNLVQIAHNVVIGENCFIIAQAGIAGSSVLGRGAIAAGQAGVAGHLTIGEGAILMGQAGVTNDVPAGAKVVGMPAVDRRQFAKNQLAVHRAVKLQEQVAALRAEVAELKRELRGRG